MKKSDPKAEFDRLLGEVKERQGDLGLMFELDPDEAVEAAIDRINQTWAALCTYLLDELCRLNGEVAA